MLALCRLWTNRHDFLYRIDVRFDSLRFRVVFRHSDCSRYQGHAEGVGAVDSNESVGVDTFVEDRPEFS